MPVDRSLPQAQGGAPESDLSASIAEASQHKDCGNALFKARDWEGAATEYLVGLAKLPPRPPARKSNEAKGKARAEGERADEDAPTPAASEPLEDTPEEQEHEEPVECRTLRAVLYANVAACRAKLGDDKAVVDLCSQALLDDPNYTKALHRRAAANERIGTWAALDAANADYTTLLTLFPEASRDVFDVRRAQADLKPRLEAAKKKDMDEMVSKMKGLGNSLLGKFGLSTDNFQFTPNGQGGYSMNFVNGPQ